MHLNFSYSCVQIFIQIFKQSGKSETVKLWSKTVECPLTPPRSVTSCPVTTTEETGKPAERRGQPSVSSRLVIGQHTRQSQQQDAAFRWRRNVELFLLPSVVQAGLLMGLVPHRLDAAQVRQTWRSKRGRHVRLTVSWSVSGVDQQLQTSEDTVKLKHKAPPTATCLILKHPLTSDQEPRPSVMLCCHGNTHVSLSYVQYIYACVYLQPVSVHLIKHMWPQDTPPPAEQRQQDPRRFITIKASRHATGTRILSLPATVSLHHNNMNITDRVKATKPATANAWPVNTT